MRTALDTNVISALWSSEPSAVRIMRELGNARSQGGIVISAPVYVELLAHPVASRAFLDKFLLETGIRVDFVLEEAVWRSAGDGFAAYAQRRRSSGGTSPKRLLTDFIIASHALLAADCLFTLDPDRYKRDFPKLRLV